MSYKKKLNFRLAATATLMGNTLEWYDYSTYGFFVPIIAHLFFPTLDPLSAVMQSFLIYAVGQIGRPIGGILFGFIADRYGRRISLISSILLMTGPMIIISSMPTYLQIGLIASTILAFMRAIQGVSAGGELPVIATFLVESSPEKKRGFLGSFTLLGGFVGLFLGVIEYSWIHFNMSLETIYDWGWRIPFIFGILIGITSFYLRRKLSETPLFREVETRFAIIKDPFLKILKKNKIALANLFGLSCLQTVSFNVLLVCFTAHLIHYMKLSIKSALILSFLMLSLLLVLTPVMGKVSDRWGHQRIAQYSCIGFFFLSYPLFMLLNQGTYVSQILVVICFALLLASYSAPLPVLFCDLFPTSIRASGIGLGYNLAVGCIGGLSPLAITYLIKRFEMPNISALFLMGAAFVSFFFLKKLKKLRLYLSSET
jgi:MHS family proline/betaine transporter-like MFS transporter